MARNIPVVKSPYRRETQAEIAERIRGLIRRSPDIRAYAIAQRLGYSLPKINEIIRNHKIEVRRYDGIMKTLESLKQCQSS